MFPVRLTVPLLLLLLACAATASCTGRPALSLAPQTGVPGIPGGLGIQAPPSLPAPAMLLTQVSGRSVNYTADDLRVEGESFEPGLPNQRVTASASGAIFQPDWPKTQPSPFSGLAFAIYHISAAGYSGDPSLNLSWNTPPGIPGNLYYGFANWDANRWDWRQGEADDKLDLSNTAPYFDGFGGDMLIVVLKIGTGACELDYLRLGSLPPMRNLVAAPTAGLVPLSVDFDASASIDLDGSIVEYRWDPDGDGTFDQSSGGDPHFSHLYDTPGTFAAGLRLIDNDGISADISVEIQAFDSTTFSFGTAGFRDYPGAILPDAEGNVIVLGRRESMAPGSDYEVFIAALGIAQAERYYKSWGGPGDDRIHAARLAPDGFIYAAGSTNGYGAGETDALLQKWSPAGELLWSKTIGSAEDDEQFNDLIVYNSYIYACGSYYLNAIERGLAFIVKLDLDGNLVWQHTVIGTSHSSLSALAVKAPLTLDPPTLESCGYFNNSPADSDALYASYDLDGNMLACKLWGGAAESQFAVGVCVTGTLTPLTTVAGYDFASQYISFVSHPGGTVYLLSSPDGLGTRAVGLHPGGGAALSLLMGGRDGSLNSEYFVLARFGGDLTLSTWQALSSLGDDYNTALALSSYSGPHLAVTGYQDGLVPAPLAFNLEQSPSLEAWEDISPSQGNPTQLVVADTPLTTIDISGGVFNREGNNDFDSLIHITPSN